MALKVHWEGNTAKVTYLWKNYDGDIVGMRKHDKSFKFSVFFFRTDGTLNEVVVFGVDQGYRLGMVVYDLLDTQERVVHSIMGFEDAKCIVLD